MTTNLKNNPNSSILKEARLAKGLSLDVVHEATKIPMDALRAIEEGYSTRILTPFYYRGFIKIYAEFLGLNVTELLKEYNVPIPDIVKPILKKTPTAAPKSKKINVAPDHMQEFIRNFWTAKTKKNLVRGIAILIALFVVVKLVGCVAAKIKAMPKQPKQVTQPKVKKTPPKKEPVKEEAVVAEVPVVIEEQRKVAAQSKNHKVTLAAHASKDTPIQVKADGKIVFQMTMKKGTVENWEANDQIELSGKNVGELTLEVNGKDVNSLGSSNRRVKRVVITKDGLTVKK